MIEALAAIVKALLGLVTFAAIFFYFFALIPIKDALERWPITGNWPPARRDCAALLLWALGALGLWLIWRFGLPNWWIEATPMIHIP